MLYTTTCSGVTYVNPAYQQVARPRATPGGMRRSLEEKHPISGAVMVFPFNDADKEDYGTRFLAYDGKYYSGVVSCEVFHGERMSWKCNDDGSHEMHTANCEFNAPKCLADGCVESKCGVSKCFESGTIYPCWRYNSYALGSASTNAFWTQNNDQTNAVIKCSRFVHDTCVKIAQAGGKSTTYPCKKFNHQHFDCVCKPVGNNGYVYPHPVYHGSYHNQPFRWAYRHECGKLDCPQGQYFTGCVMPKPASFLSNELMTLIGGYEQQSKGFGTCINCPAGKYNNQRGQSSCSVCGTCGPGLYRTGCGVSPWTSAGSCVACPAGKFKNTTGAWNTVCTQCPVCPANSVYDISNTCGQASPGTCVCDKGYYRDNTDNTCKLCELNHYKDWTGDQACNTCNSGMTTDATGSTDKTACNCKKLKNFILSPNPNQLKCVPCGFTTNFQRPLKEIGQAREECLPCDAGKYFVGDSCVDIPIMKLTCTGTQLSLNPTEDKKKFQNELIIVPLDSHMYLTSTFMEQPCNRCGSYKYADACGRPGTDDDVSSAYHIWIRHIHSQYVFRQLLDANFHADSSFVQCTCGLQTCEKPTQYEPSSEYQIERAGKCLPCTSCGTGRYNDGCPLSKGMCQSCDPAPACSMATQYWNHNLTDGCNNPEALTPYFCKDCETWHVSENNEYSLIVGCGQASFDRWDPNPGEGSTPAVLTCTWEVDETWSGGTGTECTGLNYNQYGQGQELSYCPPGWYVDATCVVASTTWDASCCRRCGQSCQITGEKKQSATYIACDGRDSVDTQQCVTRCENGFYGKEGVCIACEMCVSNL